jgi:voltage-gated potassium channel Kch
MWGSIAYQVWNVLLILASTGSFLVSTEPQFHNHTPLWALIIDIVSAVFFTSDYFLRLYCSFSRLQFITNTFNIFDFLSFAPLYIEWIAVYSGTPVHIAYLRLFRLLRVFRLLRLIRLSKTLKIAVKSVKASYDGALLLIMIILLNLVFFSTTMYFVESSYCYFDPTTQSWLYTDTHNPSPFQSISSTFWWNIVTITTVGYGDAFPITAGGKIVASFALVSGIIFLAFPIAIFGTNFHLLFTDSHHKDEERANRVRICGTETPSTKEELLLVVNALADDLLRLQEKSQLLRNRTEDQQHEIASTLGDIINQINAGL